MNNQLLASDNFASGSLASGWGTWFSNSKCQVVSGSPNTAQPNVANTTAGQIWTGLTWPNDQASEATVTLTAENNAGGSQVQLGVRIQSGVYSGYVAVIQNTTSSKVADIYRVDSGAATSLKLVSGLTHSPGDVWSFQAVGANLCLYQNDKLVMFTSDGTYASGSPGFVQYAQATVGDSKVLSWRGYSAIQQDGIWKKQGISILPIAADLAAGAGYQKGTSVSSHLLYEGNAQILSGTVYKMWFSSGANIGYAESLDGKSWTRYASAVLTNKSFPEVIKSGSTYYLYVQPDATGTGAVSVYTSPDGLTWTLQSSAVLAVGGVGAWDHGNIFSFKPVFIDGSGTWWAVYAGVNAAFTVYALGVASSPDGITWTKYASNPVYNSVFPTVPVKVGSTWYMWCGSNTPGEASPATAIDPQETIIIQSPDLLNWSGKKNVLHHAELVEGVNGSLGFAYVNSVAQIGNQTFLYYDAGPSDTATTSIWQICYAIAPAPVASIVLKAQDGSQPLVSTNFPGGAGNLSANWVTPTGATKLQQTAGGLVEPSTTANACTMANTSAGSSTSQYAELTLSALLSTGKASPTVYTQTGANSFYNFSLGGALNSAYASFQIFKTIAGVATAIGPTVQVTPQAGDVFRLLVFPGTDGFNVLQAFQNGFLILSVQDYSNALTSGFPGLTMSGSSAVTDAQGSLWAGGNANVIPTYSKGELLLLGVGT